MSIIQYCICSVQTILKYYGNTKFQGNFKEMLIYSGSRFLPTMYDFLYILSLCYMRCWCHSPMSL